MDVDGLKQINQLIVKKAVENKVFENGTIDGYTVVAIDGTKFFGSNKENCSECLRINKGEKTHSFHSGAVMSTVGTGPKLVIGFEMYKPGQCVKIIGLLKQIIYKKNTCKTYNYSLFYIQKTLNYRCLLKEENREVGVNPTRSRHCKRGARSITTSIFSEGASDVLIRKPGDLPVV